MLNVNGRGRRAALYLVTLVLPLSILFSIQTPAYAQCGIDWVCQTVDSAGSVGWYTSLAFGTGPAISYYDRTNYDLKFAYDRNNDGDFADAGEIITVDSAGHVGAFTSLAFGTGPAISYRDATNGDLKFAYDRNNDGDFADPGEIITVDSAGYVGEFTSLAFGSGPAISYWDYTNDDLKLAYDRNNDGDFADAGEIITVDSAGNVGIETSLAFGTGPAISYFDHTNNDLKFAYDRNNDGDFADAGEIITVDSAGYVGDYTSLAFGSGPAISYYDWTNWDLKFAYDRNNDGDFADAGEIISVDSAGVVGAYTSLAFGSGPAISYWDYTNDDLKFARYPPPTITSVDPNQGYQGETLGVTISGTYLTGATAVSLGAGIAVNSFTIDSPTQITANISIDAAASPGARDVSVTTIGGTATLFGGFTVIEPVWTYIFEDPTRGTELRVSTDDEIFQFLAPDGYDSGVVRAAVMRVLGDRFSGRGHAVAPFATFSFRALVSEDRCIGSARVRQPGGPPWFQRYRIHDPGGFE